MVEVLANTRTTVLIRPGELLRVTGDGNGAVTRLAYPNGSGDPYSPVEYSGSPQTFGPYETPAQFRIYMRSGSVDYLIISEDAASAAPKPSVGGGIAFTLSTVALFATAMIPAEKTITEVFGYAVEGDSPSVRYRRTKNATEATYPSARADATGAKWIIDEDRLLPEWFGAKGNSNGYSVTNPNVLLAGASGADDAPAFRAADIYSEATGIPCETIGGKKYRMGSHIVAKSGQKTVMAPGSLVRWRFKSDLIHDSYDPVSGSVMFIFTNGTKAAPVNRVSFIFDGGRLIHPDDAVKPRPNASKGSITIYHAFDAEVLRVNKSGQSPTNFQVSVYNSSIVTVDGGTIGYPIAPFNEYGDDGAHVIVSGNGNACRHVRIRNLRIRSGDDPLSITAELNAVNCVVEKIFADFISCETREANLIKIHIVNDTASNGTDDSRGNLIQKVYINTHVGELLDNIKGAGCTINNDRRDKNNIIRKIYIDGLDSDVGQLPKTDPTVALQGQHVRVYGADEVHFTRAKINGQQNSAVVFVDSKGSSFEGIISNDAANNNNVTLLSDLAVTKAMNGGVSRRITFGGSPDLSAVAAQVALWSGDVVNQINDNKLPILTMSGMATAGHNGSFVIKAVDNVNKTVDVDNFRGGTAEEPTATGTATISTGTMPMIMLIDCQNTRAKARCVLPLSWATAFVAGRSGTSKNNEVVVDIEGQRFGHAIYSVRSRLNRYGFNGRDCRSGSVGAYGAVGGGSAFATTYNHWLASDDFDALADAQGGWGRTVLSETAGDRFDLIRGRTPTVIQGSVTQAAGSTLVGGINGIGANNSVYGGSLPANVNNRHLRSLTPRSGGHDGINDVNWDATNAKFVVNTKTAPTAAVTWDYVVAQPD